MKLKTSIILISALFVTGAVLSVWSLQIGFIVFALAAACSLIVISWMQRLVMLQLRKLDRSVAKVQGSVTWGNQEILKYSSSIFRRTQGLSSVAAVPNDVRIASDRNTAGRSAALFGRAATPEVKNPLTTETLHSMLNPDRRFQVAGLYSVGFLPNHNSDLWQPSDVVASLERAKPDLILIDELHIQQSPVWGRAFGSTGTALMKELLDAVAWAKQRGIFVYLLKTDLPPDIHSQELRSAGLIELPLQESTLSESAGGAQSEILMRIQELALQREVTSA